MSFTLDLKAFADKTNKRANLVVRKIVFDVDTSLVLKSPVGDPELWKRPAPLGYVGGRFRANWQYGESTAPSGELYESAVAQYSGPYVGFGHEFGFPGADESIERETAKIAFEAAGKKHYLVNNLPYGPRLENGWSSQAPAGMVSLTVIEFEPIVKAAVAAVKAGA